MGGTDRDATKKKKRGGPHAGGGLGGGGPPLFGRPTSSRDPGYRRAHRRRRAQLELAGGRRHCPAAADRAAMSRHVRAWLVHEQADRRLLRIGGDANEDIGAD